MNDSIRKMGILDEVPPEAWMNSEVDEGPAGSEDSVHLGKHRADVGNIRVEICRDDSGEAGIREWQSISAGPDQVASAAASHLKLISGQVHPDHGTTGRHDCLVMKAAATTYVEAESRATSEKLGELR